MSITEPQLRRETVVLANEAAGWAAAIHPGKKKPTQQDAMGQLTPGDEDYSDPSQGYLFIVADGVGSTVRGDEASQTTIETILAEYSQHVDAQINLQKRLPALINVANRKIKEIKETSAISDMATTCVCLSIRDREATIAWVGDSRAYCLRAGKLLRWTKDHSWSEEVGLPLVEGGEMSEEELRTDKRRHQITRALGAEDKVEASVMVEEVQPSDRLLLCSDGLWDMVPEEQIAAELGRTGTTLEEIAVELVAIANRRGGKDNISLYVIDVQRVLDMLSQLEKQKEEQLRASAEAYEPTEMVVLVRPGPATRNVRRDDFSDTPSDASSATSDEDADTILSRLPGQAEAVAGETKVDLGTPSTSDSSWLGSFVDEDDSTYNKTTALSQLEPPVEPPLAHLSPSLPPSPTLSVPTRPRGGSPGNPSPPPAKPPYHLLGNAPDDAMPDNGLRLEARPGPSHITSSYLASSLPQDSLVTYASDPEEPTHTAGGLILPKASAGARRGVNITMRLGVLGAMLAGIVMLTGMLLFVDGPALVISPTPTVTVTSSPTPTATTAPPPTATTAPPPTATTAPPPTATTAPPPIVPVTGSSSIYSMSDTQYNADRDRSVNASWEFGVRRLHEHVAWQR
jgi:serine/threonine protein phosphatase PrpC